ncbi:HNH endonuclease [Tomitella gaofuii]|uniref:HNH endonuclease n=1 Tax=Tomitella gaofuii TaxID=2760083 RepID=UPI0015FC1235|nr:HNH endonuclease [Tomitella gaofuii]
MSTVPTRVADAVKARAGGHCEIWLAGVCTTRVEHLHHRRLRSQGGRHTVENLAAICRACHDYAHNHPRKARECGWIVPSWSDPDTTPMVRRGLATLFLSDGRVHIQEEP